MLVARFTSSLLVELGLNAKLLVTWTRIVHPTSNILPNFSEMATMAHNRGNSITSVVDRVRQLEISSGSSQNVDPRQPTALPTKLASKYAPQSGNASRLPLLDMAMQQSSSYPSPMSDGSTIPSRTNSSNILSRQPTPLTAQPSQSEVDIGRYDGGFEEVESINVSQAAADEEAAQLLALDSSMSGYVQYAA